MKEGDRVKLINRTELERVSMRSHEGKIGILKGRLTQLEIDARSSTLDRYVIAWWVVLEKDPHGIYANRYYVPEGCFIRADNNETEDPFEIQTRKEQTAMALHAITILKTPSVRAQEAGEVETIIVPGTEVVAHDASVGICLVAAANAEKINALAKEGAKLRVIARNLG